MVYIINYSELKKNIINYHHFSYFIVENMKKNRRKILCRSFKKNVIKLTHV